MRALTAGTNVDSPSADYPKGRVRDKAGATAGTILNEVVLGDIYQTIQKALIDAGITENGNPDNVSNGYQILQAIDDRFMKSKRIDIGDWDIEGTSSKLVAHGITDISKIRTIEVTVRNDTGTELLIFPKFKTFSIALLSVDKITATNVELVRLTTDAIFSDYSSTGYNRGYVTIKYID